MGNIFNVDLSYTTHYEGIEANSEEEALEIALDWWNDCIPNSDIVCVHKSIKRYKHPFSDEEFSTFDEAKHNLLANFKDKLRTNSWYWNAFESIKEYELGEGTFYSLLYGTEKYREYVFNRWEKMLDEKVCERAIKEIEITIQ